MAPFEQILANKKDGLNRGRLSVTLIEPQISVLELVRQRPLNDFVEATVLALV